MENNFVTFYPNSYFDDVVGFLHADVLTSQDKYKRYSCNECGKNLYEAKDKKNKGDFVELINSHLKQISYSRWPYKKNLFIQLSVTNTQSKINRSDIDNLLKTVLDAIKGIVFVDDNQVCSVFAEKGCLYEIPMSSFVFGIKELELGERAQAQDSLWSANEAYTKELRLYRKKIGKEGLFKIITLGSSNKIVISEKKFNKLMGNYERDRKGEKI